LLALLFCSFTGPFLGLGVMDLTGRIGAYKSYGTAVVALGYDSFSGIVALAPGRIGAAAGFLLWLNDVDVVLDSNRTIFARGEGGC
jgi:hypothetical protein